jgi:hypothetical protein
MSYFTTHQCDVMAVRMKHRYEQPQGMELEIEHGPAIGMQTVLSGGSLWPA